MSANQQALRQETTGTSHDAAAAMVAQGNAASTIQRNWRATRQKRERRDQERSAVVIQRGFRSHRRRSSGAGSGPGPAPGPHARPVAARDRWQGRQLQEAGRAGPIRPPTKAAAKNQPCQDYCPVCRPLQSYRLICSGEPLVPRTGGNAREHTRWEQDMCSTPCMYPAQCALACCFPWCFAYSLRRQALDYHMERYMCCQGTATSTVGKTEAYACPKCCNCLEALLCLPCSIAGSREVTKQLQQRQNDPCDDNIQRCNNCCADGNLCCTVCCASLTADHREAVVWALHKKHKLNICGRAAYLGLLPCMQIQTWLQLKHAGDARPAPARALTGAPPVHQTLHRQHPPYSPAKAWQSPGGGGGGGGGHRRHAACTCGYEGPPTVRVVDAQPRRYWNNKVHPVLISQAHPLAKHLHGLTPSPQKDAMHTRESDAIRAHWSTARINQARLDRDGAGYDSDEDSDDSGLYPRRDSPARHRARLAPIQGPGSAGGSSGKRAGRKSRVPPRFDLTGDSPRAGPAPVLAPAGQQYEILKLQKEAAAQGEKLLEGRARPKYASTAESLGHVAGERYSGGRMERGEERRLAEEGEARRLDAAATRVQAAYRGHKVRRDSANGKGSFRAGMIRRGDDGNEGGGAAKVETDEELQERLTRELRAKIARDEARVLELEAVLAGEQREKNEAAAAAREAEEHEAAAAAAAAAKKKKKKKKRPSQQELAVLMQKSSFKSSKPVFHNPRAVEAKGNIGASGAGERGTRAREEWAAYKAGQAL